jgi:protein tyrosine phosphatase (PTP) superfamily phosphohydrolase (DUF442 family)
MSISEINNLLIVNDRLGTSGQPLDSQFQSIANAGYETLINLATPDSKGAVANEGEIVTTLGMIYVHIPVVWTDPRVTDWELFADLLNANQRKTYGHCVVNMRVSAFTFLYRVIHMKIDPAEAKNLMNQIWSPNAVWEEFVDEILRDYDIDYFSI